MFGVVVGQAERGTWASTPADSNTVHQRGVGSPPAQGLNEIQSLITHTPPTFPSKTIRHTKNQENVIWNKKRSSIDANTEITDVRII